jgi:phosphoglycolate phosphatase
MHLLLFDIDGTLIRGKGMGRLAMARAFAEVFALRIGDHPEINDVPFAGSTDPVILTDMARALKLPSGLLDARRGDLEAAYYRHLRITVADSVEKTPCPGVVDLLPRLAADPGLTLALLTGNFEPGARIKLEPFDLNRYFAFGGFGGDGDGRAALAAHALARARERTGLDIPPGSVVLIGDTVEDVTAGRVNGFLTAAVATGWAPPEALRIAGANAVFADLTPAHGFERWLTERRRLAGDGGSV